MPSQNPGEIGIDLRLNSDKVAKDIADAGRSINSGLASSVSGLRKVAGPTTIEAEDEQAAAQRRRDSIGRRNRNAALDAADRDRERRRFEKANPIPTAPTAGRLPVATMLAGLGLGVPGLGSIAALGQMHPAMAAIVGGMRLFRAEMDALTRTIHNANQQARQLYAKTLRSGLGTEMTAHRSALAQVIGVSEDEVYQFGAAVAFLNGRLEFATSKIAANNPVLTAAAWNVEIMKKDLEALGSTIAAEAAPAVNVLAKSISVLAKVATEAAPAIIKFATQIGVRLLTQNSLALTYLRTFIEKNAESLGLKGAGNEQAPSPVAFMKQMPASQWERMGLVVGTAGATNYQQKTATNTALAVQWLQVIAQKLGTTPDKAAAMFHFNLPSPA